MVQFKRVQDSDCPKAVTNWIFNDVGTIPYSLGLGHSETDGGGQTITKTDKTWTLGLIDWIGLRALSLKICSLNQIFEFFQNQSKIANEHMPFQFTILQNRGI